MDILGIHKRTNIKPAAGKLLIAEPFLSDPGFVRTVVFLCEHGDDGTIGFVLNRPSDNRLGDVLPNLKFQDVLLYNGGPVQKDTLHMIHKRPEVMGGTEIIKNVFWGGSYKDLCRMMAAEHINQEEIRLFIGYSGWEKGQLEEELKEGSWLVADHFDDIIFKQNPDKVWEAAIRSLGRSFANLVHLPLHPELN